jgi:outer membrane protein assembly factor BamB
MSKAIPVTLGAVMGSVLCLSAAATPADVRTQFKALLEIRESLRAELQKRWDTTRPQVLELRAVDGADTYDLELAVKQSDGKWVGSLGWVPAWDQLTMGDYRAYFYSSHGTGFLLPRHAFPGDPASLSLKDGRLGGSMPIAFKLDQTLIEKMPPGRRHNWWDRFEPRGFTKDRPQTYSFDAKTDPASIGVEMFLQGAVEYPPAKDGKHNPYAQSILVRMQAPGTRFTPTDVTIMSFNMGKHEGNAEGVKFANGHLTGELVVTINSDSWYPNTTKIRPASSLGGFTNTLAQTGKLLGRLPPIIATFALDAKLENNRLRGSYTARGDMGEFTGKIVGHGGTAVLGRYTSTGAMPNQSGMVRGMLLNDFGKVDAMLTPAPELPAEDPAALAAVAAAVGDVVVEARALHLALQAHPLPLFHALDQVDTTRPQWPAEGPSPEALAAYVTAAVSALKSALPPDAKPPEAAAEAGGASPSSGSAAMAVADGANVLPPTFGGWLHPVAWSVIGGFDERPGFEHRTAFVPDIVVAPGTPVRQMIGSGGAFANPSGSVRSWTNIVADTRTMMPPFFRSWDQALGKGQFSQVYYGAAKIRSDSARKVWINMETHDYAGVWMNGRLLWSETRLKSVRQRPLGRFVAQAEVEKGDNVLLARMVQDRRTPYVAISFSADDPKAGTPVPAPAKDPLDAKAEPANPPTACDVEKGVNVLWRSADMAGDTPPAVVGDRVWVTRHHDELVCLDAETGKPKWAQRLNAYEALGLDAEYQKALGETDARSREDMLRKLAAKLGTPNVALSASAPVTDGRTTFLANAIGEVAAFDAAGKKVWSKPTDVFNPQVHRYGDTLVVQGYAGKSWPKTDYVSPFATDAKRQPVGVVLFRAADGVEIGRSSNNRKPEIGMFLQPRGSDKVYYVSNGYILLDLATGKAAAIVDIHAPYDQAMCASQGRADASKFSSF